MSRKRQHWIDTIAQDLQTRVRAAIPAVAEAVRGEVPIGYEPPRVKADEVDAFLNLDGEGRLTLYRQMGPERYGQYTNQLMQALTQRYGAAAQVLMPLLEGVEAQDIADAASQPPQVDPTVVARQRLTDMLGVDPFSIGEQ